MFIEFLKNHHQVYVHPIVSNSGKKVSFFEILSRIDIAGDIHQPEEFLKDLNTSQKLKLAIKIIEDISRLQKKYPVHSFSFNISSLEIEECIEDFLEALCGKDLEPSRCVVEIVESAGLTEEVIDLLKDVKKKYGFRFALDDFGSGYSNFKQIYTTEELFDYIKIDSSLVIGIDKCEKKKETLHLIIQAIKINGKTPIVEYVSTKSIYDAVKCLEVDHMQGYIFGKPMMIENFCPSCLDFLSEQEKNTIDITFKWTKRTTRSA